MPVQVLLIEDDETIAEPLAEGLGHFGLAVRRVATGAAGLEGPHGDVVLLDLGLPDMDGIDVCRGIRKVSDVPVIILSARGEEADRVLGLELGADDYLAKPFSLRELVARIRAVTRRTRITRGDAVRDPRPGAFEAPEPVPEPPAEAGRPRGRGTGSGPVPAPVPASGPETGTGAGAGTAAGTGPLVVDRRTRQVWVGGVPVALTLKEFELLALLAEDPGAVYSRQSILDRVWDPHYEGPTKTLDVHIATLRRKLGDPAWIQTLRGVGFRLAVHTPRERPRDRPGEPGGGPSDAPEAAFP